jgi:hypothetical protein
MILATDFNVKERKIPYEKVKPRDSAISPTQKTLRKERTDLG